MKYTVWGLKGTSAGGLSEPEKHLSETCLLAQQLKILVLEKHICLGSEKRGLGSERRIISMGLRHLSQVSERHSLRS